ncbi:lipase 3-like [Musca vetustissima]|uniref:lipase 3-like n=1 Tax=Musca vetustissima TaxID=27455 RepID=UPI002AB741FD|nr:lipase 3-like [Musca vetustissima]
MNIKVISIFVAVFLLALQNVGALTTADRIKDAGYHSEAYNVTTPDGFGITVFRIRKPSAPNDANRPVALLQHGLVSSSDIWVLKGVPSPLAYTLVENGYDVWLGNTRGNPYGGYHPQLSMDSAEYWRFTWHQIGVLDLPSIIDFVLKTTKQNNLHYVGHSQGTTTMFVLLSSRPEYNAKLRSVHLLAPVTFMEHSTSTLIKLTAPLLGSYSFLTPLVGDNALIDNVFIRNILGMESCRRTEGALFICPYLFFLGFGGKSDYTLEDVYPDFYETHPARCSTNQAIHYVQLYKSRKFRQFDFGTKGNQEHYKQDTPPDYQLANVNPQFPLHYYHSKDDSFSAVEDVEHLVQLLGNKTVRHFIDLDNFAHMDFVLGYNVKDVVNADVLSEMKRVDSLLQ